MRCLKKFIFKRPRAAQPGRANAEDSGRPWQKSKKNSYDFNLIRKIAVAFGPRVLGGRAGLLKLDGYVLDGRERAEDVNFLVRRVDINLQSCSLSAYPHVLVMIVNFHKFSIRILFEFFDDGTKDRHGFAAVLGGVPQVLVRPVRYSSTSMRITPSRMV